MNQNKLTLPILLLLACISTAQTEEEDSYIEFNDRRNVVHGVYLGLTTSLGEIDGNSTYLGSLKVAYVANRKFEVGFAGVFLYSEKGSPEAINEDLIGGYGGLHLEPILFSKSWINLSFPMLIGAGGVGYLTEDRFAEDFYREDVDAVFVVEPGMNMLFNVSRYLQLEVGMRYRFSSKIDLSRDRLRNINGFSAGVGIKVGVFNMGRNRYKKHLDNGQ